MSKVRCCLNVCALLIAGIVFFAVPAQAAGPDAKVPVSQTLAKPFRDKWAVVVGVSKFLDGSLNILYGAKDASDFARFLVEKSNFAADHVLLLTDENAAKHKILDALSDSWLPRRAQPDDLVVFFASSHAFGAGLPPGGGLFIAYDTDPNSLFSTGIGFRDITSSIERRVQCRQAVFFLDGANSDMVTPFKRGQIVITSGAQKQRSWESRRYANGVFTRQLIEALQSRGASTRLGDAFDNLKGKVEAEVKADRKAEQTPAFQSVGEVPELLLASAPVQARVVNMPPGPVPSGGPLQSVAVNANIPVRPPVNPAPVVANQNSVLPLAERTNAGVKESMSIPDTPVRDKWALVIGISKFENPNYNLKCADKDARDFYDFLVNVEKFQPDHIKLLINEEATRANIMSAFGSKWLPSVVEEGDMVVIYISTHGTPSDVDKGHRNYIVAYNTDAGDLYPTGVDMDDIYARIRDGVKSDRVLIILDTCYSGAGVPGGKGLVRYTNFNVDQVPLGRGHLIISSSKNNQRSWESKSGTNSVFTRHLIEALKTNDGKVDVVSAFNKLKGDVQWEVKRDRGEEQVPVLGGNWTGRKLILSAPAVSPRSMKD